MSHLTKVSTQFKDVAALRAACTALGWTCHENRPVRYYRGNGEICDFVFEFGEAESSISRTYNMGFQRQQDGSYRVLIDNSIHGRVVLEEGIIAGETPRLINTIKQRYGLEVLRAKAHQKGARTQVQQAADGSYVLDIVGGAFAR